MEDRQAELAEQVLARIDEACATKPDLASLRALRAILTDSELSHQIADLVARAHNRPEKQRELFDRFRKARHALRDISVERTHDRRLAWSALVGSGTTLTVGSVVALATQVVVYPPMVLLVLAAGAYSAWRGSVEGKRLALEITVLSDIDELLAVEVDRLSKGVSR